MIKINYINKLQKINGDAVVLDKLSTYGIINKNG